MLLCPSQLRIFCDCLKVNARCVVWCSPGDTCGLFWKHCTQQSLLMFLMVQNCCFCLCWDTVSLEETLVLEDLSQNLLLTLDFEPRMPPFNCCWKSCRLGIQMWKCWQLTPSWRGPFFRLKRHLLFSHFFLSRVQRPFGVSSLEVKGRAWNQRGKTAGGWTVSGHGQGQQIELLGCCPSLHASGHRRSVWPPVLDFWSFWPRQLTSSSLGSWGCCLNARYGEITCSAPFLLSNFGFWISLWKNLL